MHKTATSSMLALFIVVLATVSCSKQSDKPPQEIPTKEIGNPANEIDLTGHYDPTQSFQVIDQEQPKDGKVNEFEIRVTDPRHKRFLSWLESNEQNWEPAHNTHAGLVIIIQDNFRLLLYRDNDFAVVIITDEEGVSNYYKKSFDVGGLDFLDE